MRTWRHRDFEILAATDQGDHAENQDAFSVSLGPPLRVGVFDGVGGHAHGRAAAQAGARCLLEADWPDHMEGCVRATRGVTTATVAEVAGDRLRLHWAGDSGAFLLGPTAEPLVWPHRTPHGQLTCAVGAGGTLSNREHPLQGPVVLCTDGLHDWMASWPMPGTDLGAWAAHVLDSVRRAGSRDDATLVVLRRRPRPGLAKGDLMREVA